MSVIVCGVSAVCQSLGLGIECGKSVCKPHTSWVDVTSPVQRTHPSPSQPARSAMRQPDCATVSCATHHKIIQLLLTKLAGANNNFIILYYFIQIKIVQKYSLFLNSRPIPRLLAGSLKTNCSILINLSNFVLDSCLTTMSHAHDCVANLRLFIQVVIRYNFIY